MRTPTWWVCPRPNVQAPYQLYCFPHAGSGIAPYNTWPALASARLELRLVQLPGRESRLREPPFTRWQPLVTALAEAIQQAAPRAFAFWGHSMGALLSFEVARCLRARGGPLPAALFLSSHRAPHLPNFRPPQHLLTDQELVKSLNRLSDHAQLVLENAELRQLVLPIIRADFEVCETYTYQPQPPLPCPFVVLGGLADEMVSQSQLEAWRIHTTGDFQLQMFPAGHFFVHAARTEILGKIDTYLQAS